MKAALLALTTLGLTAQAPAVPAPIPPPIPATTPGGLPCDAKDKQPLLLGAAMPQEILAHRPIFKDNLAKVKLTPELKARWKAVRQPFTLVVVFGSWCGDSHYQLPDLLALEAEPNPFVEVRYLGVYRDKAVDGALWPKGCEQQKVQRVPTFYLFALQPGGAQKLMGSVAENPPKAGQTMAEALVELLETAAKAL